jgi:hypothetical protein
MQTSLINNKQEDIYMQDDIQKPKNISVEPILQENQNRFVLFPISRHIGKIQKASLKLLYHRRDRPIPRQQRLGKAE